jgi:hypothetical protein
MTLVNGDSILRASGLSESQEACIEALQQAIDEVRSGNVDSVGVVCCFKDGFASVTAGRRAGDLYLGAGDLQRKILDRVTGRDQPAGRGSIMKVAR